MRLRDPGVRGEVHHRARRDAGQQDGAALPGGEILRQEIPPDGLPSQPAQLRPGQANKLVGSRPAASHFDSGGNL